jgi:branched-chain amino acid transport system ATP-binding protein
MLALVRTFLSEPKIVVVDEASLGLAPLIVNRIFDTLKRIAESGVCLLIVEQYVTRALELADSVYLINRGQIVFSGPANEVQGDDVFERYLGIEVTG